MATFAAFAFIVDRVITLNAFTLPVKLIYLTRRRYQMTYLDWVVGRTSTQWWHDSADPAELPMVAEEA